MDPVAFIKIQFVKFSAPIRRLIDRRRLNNRNVSVVAANCWGGFMMKHCGIPFNTPFVGMFIWMPDFIRILEQPELLTGALTFIPREQTRHQESLLRNVGETYPIGILSPGEIEIHFLHYKSEEEARRKWTKRVGRINWNNVIVMMHDGDGFTEDILRRFDRLPYPQKVCFTSKPYPEYPSACYLPEFASKSEAGKAWRSSPLHWSFVTHANALLKHS